MLTQKEIEEARLKIGYKFDPSLMRDNMNRFTTLGFLWEGRDKAGEGVPQLFNLKPYNYKGTLSIWRIIVELEDPTCYLPAMVLFGSWQHWEKFMKMAQFRNMVSLALDELEIKLRAQAVKDIKEVSQGSSGSALQAAKYIAEGKWKTYDSSRKQVGRPKKGATKADQVKEAKILEIVEEETHEDYERLGLGQSGD